MELSLALESRVFPHHHVALYDILIFSLAGPVEMDIGGLMKYKEKAVNGLTSGIEMLFKKNKVCVYFILLKPVEPFPMSLHLIEMQISYIFYSRPCTSLTILIRSNTSRERERLLAPTL